MSVRREDLVNAEAALFKLQRTGGHVEPPDAIPRFAHMRERVLPLQIKPSHPVSQGQRVMGAQTFDIAYLEPGALHDLLHVAHQIEFAVGENVTLDKVGTDGFMRVLPRRGLFRD